MASVNKERVQLLVDALRSGEFEQGKGALRIHAPGAQTPTYYCCLGVATEVALRNGFKYFPEAQSDSEGSFPEGQFDSVWDASSAAQVLHAQVRDWYGFSTKSPGLKKVGRLGFDQHAAHQWNDTYDADFNQIADLFEDNYIREPETAPTD